MITERRGGRTTTTTGFAVAALMLLACASATRADAARTQKAATKTSQLTTTSRVATSAGAPASAAPAVCPSGTCAVPVATLADPTTSCQSTSLTLSCANPATYSILLVNGQNYTFTLCPTTCAGSNATFDSRLELYQGATLVANDSSTCGTNGEIVYMTDAVTGGGNYCVSVVPEAGLGDFTLSWFVTCQAPSNLLLGPAFLGTTDPTCAQDVTFSVNAAGTGDFTYDWSITPVTGTSAVPTTRNITRPENSDQFTSRITGAGTFNVSVNVTNSCGNAQQSMVFDFRDAAGPDITCTAARVPCQAPPPPAPLRGRPTTVGGATGRGIPSAGGAGGGGAPFAPPVAGGGAGESADGTSGGIVAPAVSTSKRREGQAGLERRIADNREAINRVLLSSTSAAEARQMIADKLSLLPTDVVVHDGRDPGYFRGPGQQALSCGTPCTTGTLVATHPYYDVLLNCGDGAFTARTGVNHSVTVSSGTPQNVIFGGALSLLGTSDITLHVHNNGQNFLDPLGGQACAFDPVDTPAEPNSIGLEQEWTIDPGVAGLSPLLLREEMVAFGSMEPNSGIRMTLGVQNPVTSTVTANVGVRWQIDQQNSTDDGPGFATVECSPFTIGPERFTEHEFAPTEIADFYRLQNNTGSPIFANFTSTAPIQGFPDTDVPDRLLYGQWGALSGSGWNYVSNEGANADGDSATLVYYGYDAASPIAVAPGQTVTRSVVIFTQGQQQSCGDFNPGTGVSTSIDVCQDDCVSLGATASDNCSATPAVMLLSSSVGAPLCTGNPCRVAFPVPGPYTYTWAAVDGAQNATPCTTAVNVVPSPAAVLAPAGPVCAGGMVTLDASGSSPNGCTGTLEYQFSDGGGVISPWGAASSYGPFVPSGTGPYTVEVRCTSGAVTCAKMTSQTVTVVAYPVPVIASVPAICVGGTTVLDASGTNAAGCLVPLQYQWSDPGGVVQAWSTTATYPANPGSTTVYTVEARCPTLTTCVASTTGTVTVVPLPTSAAGGDVNVCQNDPVTLDGSGSTSPGCAGGLEYEWRQGALVVRPWNGSPTWNPPVGTIGTTVYTLWVRCASATTCQASDDVTVILRNCTMAVVFDTYGASWVGSTVEVTWRTLEERDTTVFVVERGPSESGPWTAVGSPVDAMGAGFPYRLVDGTPGAAPWYRVVEYTSNGRGDSTPGFAATR